MSPNDKPPNDKLVAARTARSSPSGSRRPLSRQELAEAVNAYLWKTYQEKDDLDRTYVGHLEQGVYRWPGARRREAFRHVLGAANDADLGFYISRRATQPTSPAAPTTAHSSTEHQNATVVPADADTGWSGMLRRTVLSAPPALAVHHLTSSPISSSTIGSETVAGLASIALQYRQAYQTVPASKLLTAAQAHLNLIMSLHPERQRDRVRIPLLVAAGEMATLAGVLVGLDAFRHRTALSFFDFAWTIARATDNVELQTVILGCRSFALAHNGDNHAAGLECADFARRVGGGACPQTRAWVAAVASERCASLGDEAGCQERLAESCEVIATIDVLDQGAWRGIGGFDQAKLRAYEGGNMMRLRRYRRAEALLDDALSRLGDHMPRHRATALIDRAEARLGAGDLDAACADASQALSLVTAVQHIGNFDRISALGSKGVAIGARSARALRHEIDLAIVDHGLSFERGQS